MKNDIDQPQCQVKAGRGVEPTTDPASERLLVYSGISQTSHYKVYPVTLRIKVPNSNPNGNKIPPQKTQISSFTPESRRRLRFASLNAQPSLSAQFGMTYHNQWPADGKECKRHLNSFLTKLRRKFPEHTYLWILEFQSRGAPHFHLFTSIPVTDENRDILARYWCNTVDKNDSQLFEFHNHTKNFITWDMGAGTYLCKYLEKDSQKSVPPEFGNVGRFWGNSRNLVPDPIEVTYDDMNRSMEIVDIETGEIHQPTKLFRRWLGKLHEKQTKGYSRMRGSCGSYTVPMGTKPFLQIERYLAKRGGELI